MADNAPQNQSFDKLRIDPEQNRMGQNLDEIVIRTMQEDLSRSGLGALKKEEIKAPLSMPPPSSSPVSAPPTPKPVPPMGGTIGQVAPPAPLPVPAQKLAFPTRPEGAVGPIPPVAGGGGGPGLPLMPPTTPPLPSIIAP